MALVQSSLAAGRAFGTPLSAQDSDRYVEEMIVAAELVGVPRPLVPASVAELERYVGSVRPGLSSTLAARESMIRAAARRAATIFQPSMLPDRSSTTMTSRPRAASLRAAGGTTVTCQVPLVGSSSSAVTTAIAAVTSAATPKRSTTSRLSRSPGCKVTVTAPSPSAVAATSCRLEEIASGVSPGPLSRARSATRTGLFRPGSRTGGVTRDASGTSSVSDAHPSPTQGPGSGSPGT